MKPQNSTEEQVMKLTFWGVRGSIPAPGKSTVRYGGNTSCVSVEGKKGDLIVFDGGSGLRELGIDILKNKQFGPKGPNPLEINMFFSHVHWDHIQGVPFFKPLFIKGNKVNMYGEKKVRTCLEDTLNGQQQYPNFPITLEEISINGAQMSYTDLYAGQTVGIPKDMIGVGGEPPYHLTVTCTKLSHPDGVLCYRVDEAQSGSIVYATDTEHSNILDPRLVKIAQDADVLIYDAQYTPDEYAGKNGIAKFDWGHSTYEYAVDTAIAAGVPHLILFHHEPEHTDEDIDGIVLAAERYAKDREQPKGYSLKIEAAAEGREIEIS